MSVQKCGGKVVPGGRAGQGEAGRGSAGLISAGGPGVIFRMTTDRLPLFAFGTLRRGEPNHHYLAGRYGRALAARLPDYAIVGALMIDDSPGAIVPGELFFPLPGCYDAVLADCDALEGVTPRQSRYAVYERRRVRVLTAIGAFDAWAYTKPASVYRFAVE